MKRYLAGLIMLLVVLLALAARAPTSGSSASVGQSGDAYLPFIARQQPPTPTPTPTVTPTITATPIPPFSGVAAIHFMDERLDGWGWAPGTTVVLDVTGSDTTHKETLQVEAQPDGQLPHTLFTSTLQEGDWITLTVGSQQTGFPIALVRATGDPVLDTIEGSARPFAKVAGLVWKPTESSWLETVADSSGHFLLDFSNELEWEYGDWVEVGQYLNANGIVQLRGNSPQFPIRIPPTATPTPTPTPTVTPSHDAPPFIHIDGPSEAFVGDEVILDASRTWDIDGDPFQLEWRQYHHPDRYAGFEYVTGQDVTIEALRGDSSAIYPQSLSGATRVRFWAQWPGNYRFELVANDADGESRQYRDVLVRFRQSPFQIRGFCDGGYVPPSIGEANYVLDLMIAHGANYVQFTPYGMMENLNSTIITRCSSTWFEGVPCTTYPDELLIEVIEAAHARGLGVMLKPHLMVGVNFAFEHWRISPTDWGEWFESYRDFVLPYARIAQQCDVEILSINNELSPSNAQEQHWRDLIAAIRREYDGEITNSDLRAGGYSGHEPFTAWDAMDYVGLSYYVPGSGNGWDPATAMTDPTVPQMVQNIRSFWDRDIVPHAEPHGLPVLACEMGCANWDGANAQPPLLGPGTPFDNQEQVNHFEASLQVAAEHAQAQGGFAGFSGVFIWKLQPRVQVFEPPWEVHSHELRGQPVLQAIALWFGK